MVIPHLFLLLYPFEVDCLPADPVAQFSPRNMRKEGGEVWSLEYWNSGKLGEELQ